MEAINLAGSTVGILAEDGVILAGEKKTTSKLLDQASGVGWEWCKESGREGPTGNYSRLITSQQPIHVVVAMLMSSGCIGI